MPETLSIVVSIFGLVGLGYASARSGVLAPSVCDGLTSFVFILAIPLLLFDTLATADFHGLSPWRTWAAYFIPFAAVWAISYLIIRHVFGRDARAGIVGGVSAAYSNTALIGIPLMQAAFGESGTLFVIVIVAVHLPVIMLASVFLNEWALAADGIAAGETSRSEVFRRLLASFATNPMLISILLGVAWRATGLPIPRVAALVIEPLAHAAGPLALFASGMALVGYGIARQIVPAIATSALKLLLMPVFVFAAASAIGLSPLGIAAVTLTAACPTGVNAFLIANHLGTGQALASNTQLLSTAAGVGTVALWFALVQRVLQL